MNKNFELFIKKINKGVNQRKRGEKLGLFNDVGHDKINTGVIKLKLAIEKLCN